MPKATIYGLRDAARKANVAESTMQRYAREGVISPQRTTTGRCMFTDGDIARAKAYRAKAWQHTYT